MHRYIVIEGPIGVGKSSLSKRLADAFDYSLMLEKPEENPFLQHFYQKDAHYALATQLSFLMQRVEQINEMIDSKVAMGGCVADFMLAKDSLFAKLTLNSDELELYQKIYQQVNVNAPKPDLMIVLQAPESILLNRIKKRNIPSEQKIGQDYLLELNERYTKYFHHYTDSPLLMVNATEINPVNNDAHFSALVEQICRIKSGKHYFNPLA